jgi:hypothetical protein
MFIMFMIYFWIKLKLKVPILYPIMSFNFLC